MITINKEEPDFLLTEINRSDDKSPILQCWFHRNGRGDIQISIDLKEPSVYCMSLNRQACEKKAVHLRLTDYILEQLDKEHIFYPHPVIIGLPNIINKQLTFAMEMETTSLDDRKTGRICFYD